MTFDPVLVAEAGKGDSESFRKLYDSIYGDLYKYALYTLGSREEAMDAVSDTFFDIWKGLPGLKNPSSFGPWAFRILSLRCKNLLKNVINGRNTDNIDDLIRFPEDLSEPVDEKVSEYAVLHDALNSLPDDDRKIILLSVIHGYSNRDISYMLDMPAGTVSSKLKRGFEKLRKRMGGV